MPLPELPDVHPGIPSLDDLELFRQGLIPQGLLSFLQGPANYVDIEGVTVARLTQTSELLWIAPRSTRPYERWHTGTAALVQPMTILDHPSMLSEIREDTATIVVLASTEGSLADLHLARMAKQWSDRSGMQLVVLPLGSRASQRPEKLAQILHVLRRIGNVRDCTTPDLPPREPDGTGLVVFFTGLSGSGKSTVARALTHHLTEDCGREVSLLDGDAVRRHLTQGLTFSVDDRNTNVRRIGWVAAEIARHGGIAVASLIAPFDITRREVRRMVTERGGHFLLVHVATPLEECERRDRKGLYASARAGLIPEFTGVSSPYEPPLDADLRLDSTAAEVSTLRDLVLDALEARGWLTAETCAPTRSTAP